MTFQKEVNVNDVESTLIQYGLSSDNFSKPSKENNLCGFFFDSLDD